ncbi:MAG: heat-inducible transcriptional repressor HrcA [Deferrisomatales bacterium]
MLSTLSERDQSILGAVVEEFVQTAEPVGSRSLTRKYGLGVSPATVRNAMSDLEELGFLAQPHTSAGRQPTDRGYRYYVDHLMQPAVLCAADRRRLRQRLGSAEGADLEDLLDSTCRALSALARQVGVVVAPRFESRVFRHIDFVWLREGRVLVLLVSQSGVVHHRPVEAPEIRGQAELDQMADYLNGLLEGVPLRSIQEKILGEMASERALYDELLQRALDLGHRAMADTPAAGEVFYGDPVALLDQPEFSTAARLRGIFEAFEKKGLILKLLDRAVEADGIQVTIGEENALVDLRDCSVVSSTYGCGGKTLGYLGVIGPTRMNYPKVVGLVNYTSRLLGDVLGHL